MNLSEAYKNWRTLNPSMTLFSISNLIGAVLTFVLIFLSSTAVLNEPAWLKPFKFFLSSFILTATLPFILREIDEKYAKSAKWISKITIITMGVELIAISIQAFRGVRSHFNFTTLFDSLVFNSMAIAILMFFISQVFLTYRLFQVHFRTKTAKIWSYKLGMIIFLIGAGSGWIMTTPNADQFAKIKSDQTPLEIGSHTIGAADGAEGLPIVGWAKKAGDLRIAHFVGMHALQILPIFALLLIILRVREDFHVSLIFQLASSILLFYSATLIQALQGRGLLQYESISALFFCCSILLGIGTILRVILLQNYGQKPLESTIS